MITSDFKNARVLGGDLGEHFFSLSKIAMTSPGKEQNAVMTMGRGSRIVVISTQLQLSSVKHSRCDTERKPSIITERKPYATAISGDAIYVKPTKFSRPGKNH
jgi:hypothetical protein